MERESVRIVLNIEKSKFQPFVEMLKLLDFITIESDEEFLKRFVENTPGGEAISNDEVADILNELRHKRS